MSQYYIGILVLICINLIAVLGLSLMTGFTGLFNFGQAGFLAVGAYTATILTTRYAAPFPLALLAGMLVSALSSFLIGYPTLRLKGDYFAIATLGFAEVVRLLVENLEKLTGGSRGIPRISLYTTLPIALIATVLALWLVANYVRSRHGRNCVAVREDELAAESIGIDSFRYKQISFAINAALAGLSGGLLAHYVGFIQPSMFGIIKSTELIVMVIFGGMHSLTGAVFAAVVLTSLPEFLRAAQAWRLVAYGALVVVIMVVRPEGLMGSWEFTPANVKALFNRSRPAQKGG
ncbi:MAG: branched-chain amino acid ABC transporter permease [Chloroflexota bacterium]|nr:branched-chain amino acid ABC transporter permease [Chloroflexota bacterium]